MGWKSVKEHYKIEHFVCMDGLHICIGSGYIHDIIRIALSGEIVKRYTGSVADLNRYMREMDADPIMLKKLVEQVDAFDVSVPVFTYDSESNVVELQAEKIGYPNVTHDGRMMYDNTYFATREKAEVAALSNAQSVIGHLNSRIHYMQDEMGGLRSRLSTIEASAENLRKAIAGRTP